MKRERRIVIILSQGEVCDLCTSKKIEKKDENRKAARGIIKKEMPTQKFVPTHPTIKGKNSHVSMLISLVPKYAPGILSGSLSRCSRCYPKCFRFAP